MTRPSLKRLTLMNFRSFCSRFAWLQKAYYSFPQSLDNKLQSSFGVFRGLRWLEEEYSEYKDLATAAHVQHFHSAPCTWRMILGVSSPFGEFDTSRRKAMQKLRTMEGLWALNLEDKPEFLSSQVLRILR